MKEEKTLVLTESEVNELLKYLGSRPYAEVAGIILKLQAKWSEQHREESEKNE